MPCDCKKKRTFVRLYSANRDEGTALSPVFFLNQNIENITAFQVKDVMFEKGSISAKSIKINSAELSNLTTDTLRGSYDTATRTIHEVNVTNNSQEYFGDSPKYNCSNAYLNVISFNFIDGDGDSVLNLTSENWSMLIVFNH